MKIAVIGATGLVGTKMLQVIAEQGIKADSIIAAASERSVGKEVIFDSKKITVTSVDNAIAARPDIAIFSAGADASRQYAPLFAKNGCFVVDNSSAWRMEKNIPLVVPDINADTITADTKIIANPNCSTIQMVMALAPIHKAYSIKRLVIATYQSVSGSGLKGINQLNNEEEGKPVDAPAYPHQIYRNILPHGGSFCDNGYTTEEEKLVNETHKILRDRDIAITATVCRVPVTGGHSEAVNVETMHPFSIEEVREMLQTTPGIIVQDDPKTNLYPMAINAYDCDDVFVGRLRRDYSIANGLNMWIVSDNIRKGAATNAVQIAQYIIRRFF